MSSNTISRCRSKDEYIFTCSKSGKVYHFKRNRASGCFECPCGKYSNPDKRYLGKHLQGTSHLELSHYISNVIEDVGVTAGLIKVVDKGRLANPNAHIGLEISANKSSNDEHCLIQQPASDITDDQLDNMIFASIRCVYNAVHKIMICLDCKEGIRPKSAAAHFRKKEIHQGFNWNVDAFEKLRRRYEVLGPDSVRMPVPGAAEIPYLNVNPNGFKCKLCPKAFAAKSTVQRHYSDSHPGSLLTLDQRWEKCCVQTFFNYPNVRYFPVSPIPANRSLLEEVPHVGVIPLLERHLRLVQSAPSALTEIDYVLPNKRQDMPFSSFLQHTGWVDHLAGIDLETVAEVLVSLKAPCPSIPKETRIEAALKRIFSRSRISIKGGASEQILRLAVSEQGNSEHHKCFKLTQNVESHNEYCNTWIQLVRYISRGELLPQSLLQRLHLTRHQTEYLIRMDKLAEMEDPDEGLLDEAVLMFSLSLIRHRLVGNRFDSAILHFLAVSAVNPLTKGLTESPAGKTNRLAGVQYCCRLLTLSSAIQDWEKDRSWVDGRTTDEDEASRGGAEDAILSPLERFRFDHTKYLSVSSESPFSFVVSMLRLGMAVLKQQGGNPSVDIMLDSTGVERLWYNSRIVCIDTLKDFIQSEMTAAEVLLTEELYVPTDFSAALDFNKIYDNHRCEAPSYAVFNDPQNASLRQTTSEQIIRNFITSQYHGDPGGPLFNPYSRTTGASVCEKLDLARARFLEHLMVLMHMTGGGPARGPEFCGLLFRNTITHTRNIYLLAGRMVFVTRYHKGHSIMGMEKFIPRFLPTRVGKILMAYLFFVMPFFIDYLPKAFLDCPKLDEGSRNLLWFHSGKQWKTAKLSQVLYDKSRIAFGWTFGVAAWRHIAIAIMRNYLNPHACEDEQGEEDENDDARDLQAAHTSGTANRLYAVERSVLKSLSSNSIKTFGKVSSDWHTFLLSSSNSANLKESHQEELPKYCSPPVVTPGLAAGSLERIEESVWIPEYMSSSSSVKGNDHEELLDRCWPSPVAIPGSLAGSPKRTAESLWAPDSLSSPNSVEGSDHEVLLDKFWPSPVAIPGPAAGSLKRTAEPSWGSGCAQNPKKPRNTIEKTQAPNPISTNIPVRWRKMTPRFAILDGLKQLYGPDASFRSSYQEEALLQIVQSGKQPLIIVQPTAAGKSLLFMVPSLLQGARITVVVIPYIALMNDLYMRCKTLKLRVAKWEPAYGGSGSLELPGAQLVLVGYKQAVGTAFQKWLVNMQMGGMLERIVIDECHLLLTAERYRPEMKNMMMLADRNVPMVFLTATLPPSMESRLEERMLMANPKYFRAPTSRPNIKYSVIFVPIPELMKVLVAKCKDRMKKFGPDDKAIIFCRSKDDTRAVQRWVGRGCQAYHSDMTEKEKERSFGSWAYGKEKVIVATSALGAGVDIQNVRLVMHCDEPWTATGFAQESGRAGRDGEPAESIIVVGDKSKPNPPSKSPTKPMPPADPDARAIGSYVQSSLCRRRVLFEYLDGRNDQSCLEVLGELCDNCEGCLRSSSISIEHDSPVSAAILPHGHLENILPGFVSAATLTRDMAHQDDIFVQNVILSAAMVNRNLDALPFDCILEDPDHDPDPLPQELVSLIDNSLVPDSESSWFDTPGLLDSLQPLIIPSLNVTGLSSSYPDGDIDWNAVANDDQVLCYQYPENVHNPQLCSSNSSSLAILSNRTGCPNDPLINPPEFTSSPASSDLWSLWSAGHAELPALVIPPFSSESVIPSVHPGTLSMKPGPIPGGKDNRIERPFSTRSQHTRSPMTASELEIQRNARRHQLTMDTLRDLLGKCPPCWIVGLDSNHPYQQCPSGSAHGARLGQCIDFRKGVKFAPGSACWMCYLPMKACLKQPLGPAFSTSSKPQCLYRDIVLPAFLASLNTPNLREEMRALMREALGEEMPDEMSSYGYWMSNSVSVNRIQGSYLWLAFNKLVELVRAY